MLLIHGLGGLNGSADVTALQQALVKLGKSVTVTGTMNDSTIAALWVVIKGNLAKAKSVAAMISADASKAIGWFVDAINWIDGKVSSIPGGLLTTERVLANWVNINAVASAACFGNSTCLTVAKALSDARATTYAGVTSAAGVFAKVVTAFGTPAAPSPPTTGTVQLPPNKISMISSMNRVLVRSMTESKQATPPTTTTPPPIAPTSKLPRFLTQWWFWGVVGLTGGALVARRITTPRAA